MKTTLPAVSALLEALKAAIEDRRRSQRSLDTELGWSRGYLNQVLAARIELKVSHVYEILDVLGIEPHDFFTGLHRGKSKPTLESTTEEGQTNVLKKLVAAMRKHAGKLRELEARLRKVERVLKVSSR